MQKTFVKYAAVIITSAILLILLINFLFRLRWLEAQQLNTFLTKTEQVIHTMENNSQELAELNKSLDTDYLTRAKAAAYVMDHQKEVSLNVKEMQYLAKLLNVDELHVIDEKGFIVSGPVQDPQPNAAENKIMKYVGVVRKGQKGIVQVGFEPVRQMEAQSRNTYEYIFSKFPTDAGEELFAVDCRSGKILGHSDGLDKTFTGGYYQLEELAECTEGAYVEGENGRVMYVAARRYGDVMICGTVPRKQIFRRLWNDVLVAFLYLLIIEIAVLFLLNYLVKRKVVNGIHSIIGSLDAITEGNLDTTVGVGGNPEFEKLSHGINAMVKSIVSLSDRISSIIFESVVLPLPPLNMKREWGMYLPHLVSRHCCIFRREGLKSFIVIPAPLMILSTK